MFSKHERDQSWWPKKCIVVHKRILVVWSYNCDIYCILSFKDDILRGSGKEQTFVAIFGDECDFYLKNSHFYGWIKFNLAQEGNQDIRTKMASNDNVSGIKEWYRRGSVAQLDYTNQNGSWSIFLRNFDKITWFREMYGVQKTWSNMMSTWFKRVTLGGRHYQ